MDDLMNILNDLDNTVIDVSGNLNEVKNKVKDLSGNVAEIKSSNDLQELKIFGHGLQISANTDAIFTRDNSCNNRHKYCCYRYNYFNARYSICTGIYASIDSKTSRSLFGSGNIAIYGLGPLEYINLEYNNEHFEDIKLISNHALNLKEPYKSLPNVLNDLSDIVNTKQNNSSFTSPL